MTGAKAETGNIIAPSLLAANFGRMGAEARRAEQAGADWLHLDIMDGHFVPNISFGPAMVAVIRPVTRLFLDVHLMCSRPEILFEPFMKAGADSITVHVELGEQVMSLLWKLKSHQKKVGLAINPTTNIDALKPYLQLLDIVLVMTVNPGFGGQPFILETLTKIQKVRAWRDAGLGAYRIEADGGINFQTAGECAAAGADTFVSGTGLFAERSLRGSIRKMRKIVDQAASR